MIASPKARESQNQRKRDETILTTLRFDSASEIEKLSGVQTSIKTSSLTEMKSDSQTVTAWEMMLATEHPVMH